MRHILEHIPGEENELAYFEKQVSLHLSSVGLLGLANAAFVWDTSFD